VTSYSLTGDVLTLTGTNFPADTDYTATVNFKTAFVYVISWTSTSIVGDFSTKGLPFANSSENKVPFIRFTRKSDGVDFLSYSTGLTPLQITSVPTSSSAGVTSSFAGGLSYEISGPGITASLLEPNNRVEVCGNICKLDIQSDNTKAVCILPPLSTTYSAANFEIGGAGLIQGKWSGSVPLEVPKITDGVWPSEYNDPNANCWLEIDFPDTQVAVLDNVKVLINNLNTLKTPFAGVTKLQGWDGAQYVDILTLDATIHEGWNTFEWTSNKPAYQKYKWSGATAGACRFGEVKFHGIVAVDDNNSSIQCTPKLWLGGVS